MEIKLLVIGAAVMSEFRIRIGFHIILVICYKTRKQEFQERFLPVQLEATVKWYV